jgi:hypothetical protein
MQQRSCQCERISATATGWEMYGSPDLRYCPWWAASLKWYASSRRERSAGLR